MTLVCEITEGKLVSLGLGNIVEACSCSVCVDVNVVLCLVEASLGKCLSYALGLGISFWVWGGCMEGIACAAVAD